MEKGPNAFPPLLMGIVSYVAQTAHDHFRNIDKIHAPFHSNPFYWTEHLVHWL